MSSATALTIIAISMAVVAIVAIVAIVFLMRLVLHLIAFEQTLANELAELRALVGHLRQTTDRVSQTVHDVQIAARRIGSAMGAVATLFVGRSAAKSETREKTRSWWITGASLGWRLLKKRRQRTRNKKVQVPLVQDKTLPM